MSTPKRQVDWFRKDHWTEIAARVVIVVLVSTSVGAALGATVALSCVGPVNISLGGFFAGIYLGGGLGLLSSPAVASMLMHRRLAIALPLVYVPTCIWTILNGWYLYSDWAPVIQEVVVVLLVAAFGFHVLWAKLVQLYLPPIHYLYRWGGYCAQCGYDLTGTETGICPECGAAISRQQHSAMLHHAHT